MSSMGYDFSKLNDREFEALGASIIEKILKKRVEIFKSGRDGGVDGRFWLGNKEGIIQAKHWIGSTYTKLISELKKKEKLKVRKLQPKRYVFITSQKLSRVNKKEIKTIFHPYIKRQDDIWGQEDLNKFLIKAENQEIVERNYKLWITSTSVLDILFNSAIKGRSRSTIKDIEEHSHKYAITDNHNKGLKILKEKNVLIITGEPGIGKTTLSDNLALIYVAKGYEFCDIEENISEAESLFREDEKKKILFYYNDFLGSNFYDAVSNKKDSHIVNFIKRVSKDRFKKFILNSRTNILNKACGVSHSFKNENIRDNEFLLTVKNLTELDKAKILYNHIYHSNLKKEYIDKLYEDKKYKRIIKHRNFNPRLIEFITDVRNIRDILPDGYWKYIQDNLENPEEIWADYFQQQADDPVRFLTFLTVFNNGRISEEELQKSYNIFIKIHQVNLGDHSDKSFNAVRRLVTKSLLNRNKLENGKCEYTLFNPSIADFILGSYLPDTELITSILKSLQTKESLEYLRSLNINKKLSDVHFGKIQIELFNYLFKEKMEDEDWGFLSILCRINVFNPKIEDFIIKFLNVILKTKDCWWFELESVLFLFNNVFYERNFEIDDFDFLYQAIFDLELSEGEITELLEFINKFKVEDQWVLEEAKIKINNYLNERIGEGGLDIDYEKNISWFDNDGTSDYDIDEFGIKSQLYSCVEFMLDDFNQDGLSLVNLDIDDVISDVNIEGMVSDYIENQEPDFDDDMRHSDDFFSHQDDIDAIFERS